MTVQGRARRICLALCIGSTGANAAARTTPGNGLGLSLVAAVADLHGAKLRLENAGPGLRASILYSSLWGDEVKRGAVRGWALSLVLAALPTGAMAAGLDVEVTGVEDDRGLVRVAVCALETFTAKCCPFVAAMPA